MLLKVRKRLLTDAISELELSQVEENFIKSLINASSENIVKINYREISVSLLSYILKNSPNMANKSKAILSTMLYNEKDIEIDDAMIVWDTKIKKLADIIECFSRIGTDKINAELYFNRTWYPVRIVPKFVPASRYSYANVEVRISLCFVKEYFYHDFTIYKERLLNVNGGMRKITLRELFMEFDCRPPQYDKDEYNNLLDIAKKLVNKNYMTSCSGNALYGYNSRHRSVGRTSDYQSVALGYKSFGERVIIESELEYNEEYQPSNDTIKSEYTPLPFIRIFSFLHKRYFFVSVKDLKEYEYDKSAINRLFLPPKITHVLDKIFTTPTTELVGDILDFKHGGMIILATGNPGVGKTSSAEVYSEMQSMPLYSLDISELGTAVGHIEGNLARIFKRVEKWNAITLFDEVDIFLAKRDKNDLNRTAIVGVFLRLMDYFRGVMFLTSNMPEVLDYAIHSRVTLRIDYPDLDYNTRKEIWKDKLENENIVLEDGYSELSKIELNGRQIRNIVRLAKIVLPKTTNQKDMINIIHLTNPDVKIID
jgi:hypothetical protein